MINVRLIYEQIEAGRAYLLSDSLLGYRVALILLDSVAELLMHRELKTRFAIDDIFRHQGDPTYTKQPQAGLRSKYTLKARHKAEREFNPTTPLDSACRFKAPAMCKVRPMVSPLSPGYQPEDFRNRIGS
jgi:hypothetical protein